MHFMRIAYIFFYSVYYIEHTSTYETIDYYIDSFISINISRITISKKLELKIKQPIEDKKTIEIPNKDSNINNLLNTEVTE